VARAIGRRVVLVEWRGDPPPGVGAGVARVRARDLTAAATAGGRGTLLVLGDEALRVLEPRDLERLPPAPVCVVVAVPTNLRTSRVLAWDRCRRVEVLLEPGVGERLAAHGDRPWRPTPPADAWCPSARTARGREALAAVAQLEVLSVQAWSAATRLPERSLARLVASETGVSPKEILLLFVAASVEEGRRQRLRPRDLHPMLGYSTESGMRRAARRGRALRVRLGPGHNPAPSAGEGVAETGPRRVGNRS
jgi:hypothetical protein